MINGKTYYQILGVLPDAEDIVIKAAYRSLSQKYHPDRWAGDKQFAHSRMSEINQAYEILSNLHKRKKYDEELSSTGANKDYQSEKTEEDWVDEEALRLDADWNIACDFYPKLQSHYSYLKKINNSLAFAFKQILIESKTFDKEEQLAYQLKEDFLTRYFGDDKYLKRKAEEFILSGKKDIALDLNRFFSVMGKSVTSFEIVKKVCEKHGIEPDKKEEVRQKTNRERLLEMKERLKGDGQIAAAVKFVISRGGEAPTSILGGTHYVKMPNGFNEKMSPERLVKFVSALVDEELKKT